MIHFATSDIHSFTWLVCPTYLRLTPSISLPLSTLRLCTCIIKPTYPLNISSGGKLTNGISSAQWKQLQAMAAVTKQKQKLLEMKDYFTKKFSRILASLFENVLKHKSLHKEVKSEFTGIEIKQFSFTVVIDHGLKFSARLLNASEHDKGIVEWCILSPLLCLLICIAL